MGMGTNPGRECRVVMVYAEQLERMHEELIDRFGLPPEPAQALLEVHALRILCKPVGVARLDATHETVQLQFMKDPPIGAEKIVDFVSRRRDVRLAGPEKLRLTVKAPTWQERAKAARVLLLDLAA